MKPNVYVAIEVVSQTPKQAERGNLPTFLDVTLCLTPMLKELPDTLVAKMDSTIINEYRFRFGGLGEFTLQSYSKALSITNVGSLAKK